MTQTIPIIHITGLTGSGKSSVLNAFAGMYIKPTSKNRDTYKPTLTKFRKGVGIKTGLELSTKVTTTRKDDKDSFAKLSPRKKEEMTTLEKDKLDTEVSQIDKSNSDLLVEFVSNCDIVDFPGFGDDTGCIKGVDYFLESYINNLNKCDLAFYVVDANCPFLTTVQVSALNKIQDRIKKNLEETQHYCELFVIATKYDCQDEDIDGMWKNIHEKINVDKKNIFFLSNYQLFFTNIKDFIILPSSCKQEFINIYKYVCGSRTKIPEFTLDKAIKKSDYIPEKYWGDDYGTGDWNGLIDRISEFSNGLEERRAKPYYDKLCKMFKLNSDGYFNVNPFSLCLKELCADFLVLTKKNIDTKCIKDIDNLFCEDDEILYRPRYSREYDNIKTAKNDLALILFFQSKCKSPYSQVHEKLTFKNFLNIFSNPNTLKKYNGIVYSKISNYIDATRESRYYNKIIKIFEKSQCYIDFAKNQFAWYVLEKNGHYDKIAIYMDTSHYSKKLYYSILNNLNQRIQAYPIKEKERLQKRLTKTLMINAMAKCLEDKTEYFDYSKCYLLDKEFQALKALSKITFASLIKIKNIYPDKYKKIIDNLDFKYQKRINYYLDISDNNKLYVFPKIEEDINITKEEESFLALNN